MLRAIFGFLKDDGIQEAPTAPRNTDWNGISGQEYVHKMSEKNHNSFINGHKSLLVMFYVPWCGHCKALKPDFAQAAATLARTAAGAGSTLAAINCDENPKMIQRYDISGYPTMIYFNNGEKVGEYNQGRQASDIVSFMTKRSPF